MQTPLFFIVCVIATFTAIEARPWHRRNPTKRYGGVVASENNGATNFDVEEFGVKGGDTEKKNGGNLTHGDQNPDENQDKGENIDDQGVTEYQAGQDFQTGRRNQGGYGRQSGRNEDRESIGDWGNQGGQGYPGRRGIQGGRGNQNSDESGGNLTHGDQNPDENQDEGENIDDQGVTEYQAGQDFQTSRRNQGGYGRQSSRNEERESIGDWGNQGGQGYPGRRGIQGGRGNQNSDDRYNDEISDEEDRNVDLATLRWRQYVLPRSFDHYGGYPYGKSYPNLWGGDIDDNRKNFEDDDKDLYEHQQSGRTQSVSRGGNRRSDILNIGNGVRNTNIVHLPL